MVCPPVVTFGGFLFAFGREVLAWVEAAGKFLPRLKQDWGLGPFSYLAYSFLCPPLWETNRHGSIFY